MFIKFLIILIFTTTVFSKEIETIDFKGDIDLIIGDFSKSNLEEICSFKFPSPYKFWLKNPKFNPNDIYTCTNILDDYAKSLGFYKADISYFIKEKKATITLIKNEQIKINSIQTKDEYKKILNIKENDFFKTSDFTNSKRIIKRYLYENSYAKALLDAKAYVDLDSYKVDIVYKIEKNKAQYFGDIQIQNDANVDLEYILNQVEFKQGEKYDISLLDKTYENLYNFGIYKYISIDENLDYSEDIIPISIKLIEGDYREISYAIGYDTNTKGRLKAQYRNDNFLGNLKRLNLSVKINQDGYEFGSNISNPHFLLKDLNLTNDLSYENIDYESYEEKKIEDKIYLQKDIFDLSHSLGFLIQQSNISSKLQEYQSGNYLLNSVFYNIVLDKRDVPLNPKNGYYLSLYLENGSKFLGSDEDYIKSLAEFRIIKTIDKFTSSFKTKIGTLDKDLPIFKHFFAGGDYSNRGYSYQNVGKLDPNENPYGGLSMIDSTIEFEYKVYKDLSLATFFDFTMLDLQANSFTNDFYNSIGVGGRYYTPIGPLRVDFGFPLDDNGFVFHIGIGQVF